MVGGSETRPYRGDLALAAGGLLSFGADFG